MGCRVTVACLVHDASWDAAEATWSDFHQSNEMFQRNLNAVINAYSANKITAWCRKSIAIKYFEAVDTIGAEIFKREKGKVV